MRHYMLYAIATATTPLEINLPDWHHQGICLEMLWCCVVLKGEVKLDEDETHYEGLDNGIWKWDCGYVFVLVLLKACTTYYIFFDMKGQSEFIAFHTCDSFW